MAHVGAKVLLMQDEDFVKDFLTNLKIAEKTEKKEENIIYEK